IVAMQQCLFEHSFIGRAEDFEVQAVSDGHFWNCLQRMAEILKLSNVLKTAALERSSMSERAGMDNGLSQLRAALPEPRQRRLHQSVGQIAVLRCGFDLGKPKQSAGAAQGNANLHADDARWRSRDKDSARIK